MGLFELLLLSVGLAMDAFAVSVCKGLSQKEVTLKTMLVCGGWFGTFQALMPAIGYLLGVQLSGYITAITPWIAFGLLAAIGGNMIREALSEEEEDGMNASLCVRVMFAMAVATSIDALAVGVTFACVPVKVLAEAGRTANTALGVVCIGVVTFFISCAGVKIGGVFGSRYEKKAELAGGVILVCLGLKILLEHLL